jgi:catechol 2,3-dioxygenase-like lactoylglutathione lyase family enzyme
MVLGHYDAALAFYGEALGARVIRKHLGWYMDHAGTPPGLRKAVLTGAPEQVRSVLRTALQGSALAA